MTPEQEKKWTEIFKNNSCKEWDEESGPYTAMRLSDFLAVIDPLVKQTGFTTGFSKCKCNNCGHDTSREG